MTLNETINNLTIPLEIPLKDAMKKINSNREKILFAVDLYHHLKGSITDGDIRRALLKGMGFDCPVGEFMHKTPKVIYSHENNIRQKARKIIQEEKINAIPIVDHEMKIVDIISWHDFFGESTTHVSSQKKISTPVVIMAGGRGERLDPITKILPKALVPLGEEPLIEKIMQNFYKQGFINFTLILNYKKEMIKMYLRENNFPFNLRWVEESDYLGTAGGLGLLKGQLNETFIVCNCDTLIETNFTNILDWHRQENALMSLIGCHKEIVIPFGTVEMTDGRLKVFNEKPKFDFVVNTGAYIMEPEVLNWISEDEVLDMNHFIEKVGYHGKITVYPLTEGWYDFGQWPEYQDSLFKLQFKRN